jgi:hypothetical protein
MLGRASGGGSQARRMARVHRGMRSEVGGDLWGGVWVSVVADEAETVVLGEVAKSLTFSVASGRPGARQQAAIHMSLVGRGLPRWWPRADSRPQSTAQDQRRHVGVADDIGHHGSGQVRVPGGVEMGQEGVQLLVRLEHVVTGELAPYVPVTPGNSGEPRTQVAPWVQVSGPRSTPQDGGPAAPGSSKLVTGVRFPSPAPRGMTCESASSECVTVIAHRFQGKKLDPCPRPSRRPVRPRAAARSAI